MAVRTKHVSAQQYPCTAVKCSKERVLYFLNFFFSKMLKCPKCKKLSRSFEKKKILTRLLFWKVFTLSVSSQDSQTTVGLDSTHLIAAFQQIKGPYKKSGVGLFTRACSDRTRGNGLKLKEGRFKLDNRKEFFTVRIARHWNMLPRHIVDLPSLEVFKGRLDGALNNLVQ